MKYFYVGLLTIVMTLPATLFAKSNSASVNLDSPTNVAGQTLPAGQYNVKWTGNGPDVQVQFLNGHKVVASAPARLVDRKNPYDNAVETKTQNGSQVLTAIDRSNLTLKFGQNGSATPTGVQ